MIEITDKELTCTLSVRCDTILDNMSDFEKDLEKGFDYRKITILDVE